MSDGRRRRDPRRSSAARREAPLWRQAVDGIGMVVVFAAVVSLVGGLLALIVSWLF